MKYRGWIAAWIVAGCGPQVVVPQDDGTGSAASSEEGPDATFTTAVTTATTTTVGETGVPPDPSTTNGEEAGDDSSTGAPPGEGCAAFLACDASCQQWEVFLQGDAGFEDTLDHIAIAADGTILVAGYVDQVGSDLGPPRLLQYAADGTLLDTLTPFAELTISDTRVTGIAVADDGRIAVIGAMLGGDTRAAIVELRAADRTFIDGEIMLDPTQSLDVLSVGFAEDGALVVGGQQIGASLVSTATLRRYEPDFGFAWERVGDDVDVDVSRVNAVTPLDDGELLVAGNVGLYAWLARIASDGSVLWSNTGGITGGSGHAPQDVALSPEGNVIVVGWQAEPGEWGKPWVASYDGNGGGPLWFHAQPVDGSGPSLLDGVEIDDEGRIFVAGVHMRGGGRVRAVQQLDCDGELVWEWAHHNPRSPDWATEGGLAWSSALGLVVCGGDYVTDVDPRGFVARLVP
ncbi:MAG TPA: hypothetical protein VG755_06595 [Nannocystaceae bacterium]|nr:hypothetical protein [Nannocystaceae bacterium]